MNKKLVEEMRDILKKLRFWKDHPHAGLPSYIMQAEDCLTRASDYIEWLKKEVERLKEYEFMYKELCK